MARMLPIVFGYPTLETFRAADQGRLALGGCVVTGEDPTHQCSAFGQDVILASDPVQLCASCGTPLIDDPNDEGGLPLCGECHRARDFDADENPNWSARTID